LTEDRPDLFEQFLKLQRLLNESRNPLSGELLVLLESIVGDLSSILLTKPLAFHF
jgi:hypothetical protein